MRLAILASRIRVEEKLLIEALRQRDIAFDIIDDGELLARSGEDGRAVASIRCCSVSQPEPGTCAGRYLRARALGHSRL